MKKMIGCVGICLLAAVFFWCGMLISDHQRLREELIRLHVVANSDSQSDQLLKLQVRDAVTASLQNDLAAITDVQQAKEYLQEKLPYIQQVAQRTLEQLGCEDTVAVSLCREAFDTRVYETFTLPAGVYNALRIVIGDGEGRNWWCVVFPGLCIPAASDEMEDVAAGAGFPDTLNSALTGEPGYELRFAFLDVMGRVENMLFTGS